METDQILDLFSLGEGADSLDKGVGSDLNDAAAVNNARGREEDLVEVTGEVKEKGKRGWLDDIGELWDEGQYEEEYNLDGFLGRMKG